MPKTKFQDLIFTIIMVLPMVYIMTLYNEALGGGLSYLSFSNSLKNMWFEVIVAFLAVKFVVTPVVKKIVFNLFTPGVDKQIFITVAMACFTATFMAPMMTLLVTIFHGGLNFDTLILWLPKLVINFPFALIMQIFFIGPLVRFIFRTIFKKQFIAVKESDIISEI